MGKINVHDGLEDDLVLILLQVGQPQLLRSIQHLQKGARLMYMMDLRMILPSSSSR
jgi:hypothetical protein